MYVQKTKLKNKSLKINNCVCHHSALITVSYFLFLLNKLKFLTRNIIKLQLVI